MPLEVHLQWFSHQGLKFESIDQFRDHELSFFCLLFFSFSTLLYIFIVFFIVFTPFFWFSFDHYVSHCFLSFCAVCQKNYPILFTFFFLSSYFLLIFIFSPLNSTSSASSDFEGIFNDGQYTVNAARNI